MTSIAPPRPAIPDLIVRLKQKQAALGDVRDCKSENERATFSARYNSFAQTITGLQNAADVTAPLPLIAEFEQKRAVIVAKRAEIEKALTDAPDWRSVADGRERDREYDRQATLRRQREMIEEGTLLFPGSWASPLSAIDRRLKELTDRRDRAQVALDSHVKTAEALLV
jgi:hypothetical protein